MASDKKKKAKKIVVDKGTVRRAKARTRKTSGRHAPLDWEPAFRLLTGQYLLDFIG